MVFKNHSPNADVKGDKNQVIQDIKATNGRPVAQAGDNSTINQNLTINQNKYIQVVDSERARQLEEELLKLKQYQHPFPDRPKIGIVEPSVTFVNYIDNPPQFTGLVKAGINIPLLNIDGITAKNVITKWKIFDNGRPITSASDYFGYDPYLIDELPPNTARKLYYNPDIGASGTGTFEIELDVEYTNANTGEKYADHYRGITDYRAQKDNKPVTRVLTRQ